EPLDGTLVMRAERNNRQEWLGTSDPGWHERLIDVDIGRFRAGVCNYEATVASQRVRSSAARKVQRLLVSVLEGAPLTPLVGAGGEQRDGVLTIDAVVDAFKPAIEPAHLKLVDRVAVGRCSEVQGSRIAAPRDVRPGSDDKLVGG